jgi:hypothetical protein
MELNKEELNEIIVNVQMNLDKVGVYAYYLKPELNKNGSVRKNSAVTYEGIEKSKVRYAFLEGLLTKLNNLAKDIS